MFVKFGMYNFKFVKHSDIFVQKSKKIFCFAELVEVAF